MSGAMILRSTGRLYPGESRPRWNIGLYRRSDGAPFWQGPPDPLLCEEALPASPDLDIWVAALAEALTEAGWPVDTEDDAEVDNSRDTELEIDADTDKRELVVRGEGRAKNCVSHCPSPPLRQIACRHASVCRPLTACRDAIRYWTPWRVPLAMPACPR